VDEETKRKIIEEIRKGKNPVDIVIEYGASPNEVEELYGYDFTKKGILSIEIPDEIVALFILVTIITSLDIITTRIALLHPYTFEVNLL
jgi:hypothetical protein